MKNDNEQLMSKLQYMIHRSRITMRHYLVKRQSRLKSRAKLSIKAILESPKAVTPEKQKKWEKYGYTIEEYILWCKVRAVDIAKKYEIKHRKMNLLFGDRIPKAPPC